MLENQAFYKPVIEIYHLKVLAQQTKITKSR